MQLRLALALATAALLVRRVRSAPAALVRLVDAPARFGATCLDGSAPALYVRESAPGAPWTVAIDGGGWCFNESSCFDRSLTPLGSSASWPSTREPLGIESDDCTSNPALCANNVALLPYCDGFSFLGSRADPIIFAPNSSFSAQLWARGVNILDATIDFLVRNTSFASAPRVLIDGCSAGGLSAIQHVGRFAAALPPGVDVRAVADAGFFVDAETVTDQYYFRYLLTFYFPMHNGTAGTSPACLSARPPDLAWQCALAGIAFPYSAQPVFLVQSSFDSYQLGNVFAPTWLPGIDSSWGACINNASECSPAQTNALETTWRPNFLGALAAAGALGPSSGTPGGPHGLFLHSCFSHCQWGEMHTYEIDGVTMYSAFASWWGSNAAPPNSTAFQSVDCAGIACNPSCNAKAT